MSNKTKDTNKQNKYEILHDAYLRLQLIKLFTSVKPKTLERYNSNFIKKDDYNYNYMLYICATKELEYTLEKMCKDGLFPKYKEFFNIKNNKDEDNNK